MKSLRIAIVVVATLASGVAHAQAAGDTLRLADLQTAALQRDPRQVQSALLAQQSALRASSIGADRRPNLSLEGFAQYQSAVPSIPLNVNFSFPAPPHDTYDARLVAQQRLFDPTIAPRVAVEDAQLVSSRAQLATSLYSLRQNVNDAFFSALRSQAQVAELETSITDLEAQLQVATARVRQGAALPSEEMTLRAELLRRRQMVGEWQATRGAAVVVLEDLTGARIDSGRAFGEPEAAAAVANARARIDSVRARPEFTQFAAARAVLETQERARSAADKPRVSLFGRVGYGQPGINPLNTGFESWWLAGVQAQWNPWTWGTSGRDREVLQLQRRIVEADESAFAAAIRRATAQDLANIDRLTAALASDDQIIDLREQVLTETRARYREAVINSAEYIDRQTDVLSARITRAQHRVELAQYRAHLLTTLGIEVR